MLAGTDVVGRDIVEENGMEYINHQCILVLIYVLDTRYSVMNTEKNRHASVPEFSYQWAFLVAVDCMRERIQVPRLKWMGTGVCTV